jgi:hypothetical protein
MNKPEFILFSGAAPGAEAEFGAWSCVTNSSAPA